MIISPNCILTSLLQLLLWFSIVCLNELSMSLSLILWTLPASASEMNNHEPEQRSPIPNAPSSDGGRVKPSGFRRLFTTAKFNHLSQVGCYSKIWPSFQINPTCTPMNRVYNHNTNERWRQTITVRPGIGPSCLFCYGGTISKWNTQ